MTIDWWTLGFQAVNVVVLVWLLQHFFWRPLAAMIAQRRDTTEAALAEARSMHEAAAAALTDIAATRAGFGRERDTILAQAHSEAEQAARASTAAAAAQAAARMAAAETAAQAARDADAAAWSDRASQLAVQIAGRLAGRLRGPAVGAAFLDWLVSSINAMPAADRQAAAAEGAGFAAVSAEPLAADQQAGVRDRITAAFGATPRVTFRSDPALIAGIELHGPHFSLNNSWRADLGEILKDLRHAPGR